MISDFGGYDKIDSTHIDNPVSINLNSSGESPLVIHNNDKIGGDYVQKPDAMWLGIGTEIEAVATGKGNDDVTAHEDIPSHVETNEGRDILEGFATDDVLIGGEGADIYIVNGPATPDQNGTITIKGFNIDTDYVQINLSDENLTPTITDQGTEIVLSQETGATLLFDNVEISDLNEIKLLDTNMQPLDGSAALLTGRSQDIQLQDFSSDTPIHLGWGVSAAEDITLVIDHDEESIAIHQNSTISKGSFYHLTEENMLGTLHYNSELANIDIDNFNLSTASGEITPNIIHAITLDENTHLETLLPDNSLILKGDNINDLHADINSSNNLEGASMDFYSKEGEKVATLNIDEIINGHVIYILNEEGNPVSIDNSRSKGKADREGDIMGYTPLPFGDSFVLDASDSSANLNLFNYHSDKSGTFIGGEGGNLYSLRSNSIALEQTIVANGTNVYDTSTNGELILNIDNFDTEKDQIRLENNTLDVKIAYDNAENSAVISVKDPEDQSKSITFNIDNVEGDIKDIEILTHYFDEKADKYIENAEVDFTLHYENTSCDIEHNTLEEATHILDTLNIGAVDEQSRVDEPTNYVERLRSEQKTSKHR